MWPEFVAQPLGSPLHDPGRDTTLWGFPERLAAARARIASAARRAGRDPGDVHLLGAAKTVPVERLAAARGAGLADLGENRVQEARLKIAAWPEAMARPTWHLIGRLQSNKAGWAARLFDWVHTVDSRELARELSRRAVEAGRTVNVLVEVKTTEEATKSGVPPAEALGLLEVLGELPGVVPRGLMTMGPAHGGEAAARGSFRRLSQLLAEARERLPALPLRDLSMGMSDDFEVAVEEGATWVRLGRALFGARG